MCDVTKRPEERLEISQRVLLNSRQAAMLDWLSAHFCTSGASVMRMSLERYWASTIAERNEAGVASYETS